MEKGGGESDVEEEEVEDLYAHAHRELCFTKATRENQKDLKPSLCNIVHVQAYEDI